MSEHGETPAPAPKPRRWPWIVTIVVSLFVGIGIGAAGGDDTKTPAEPASESTATSELERGMENVQAESERLAGLEEELGALQQELAQKEIDLAARESQLGEREAAISEQEEAVAANTVGDGVWVVGVDIEPGTYRAVDVSSDCYWAITVTGSNGSDIVDNGIPGGGNPQVTVGEGQDFETIRCGDWTKQ